MGTTMPHPEEGNTVLCLSVQNGSRTRARLHAAEQPCTASPTRKTPWVFLHLHLFLGCSLGNCGLLSRAPHCAFCFLLPKPFLWPLPASPLSQSQPQWCSFLSAHPPCLPMALSVLKDEGGVIVRASQSHPPGLYLFCTLLPVLSPPPECLQLCTQNCPQPDLLTCVSLFKSFLDCLQMEQNPGEPGPHLVHPSPHLHPSWCAAAMSPSFPRLLLWLSHLPGMPFLSRAQSLAQLSHATLAFHLVLRMEGGFLLWPSSILLALSGGGHQPLSCVHPTSSLRDLSCASMAPWAPVVSVFSFLYQSDL
uniref:uncharacterized protein LOC128932205 n=1 Tax=Callithrix jacchus TaxID=9483 RepID=UPI0023DD1FF5|nr:uncharacterized protein LOC128932205 [Callithrix jacchus]